MNKILTVAGREFVETVGAKTFVLMAFVAPAFVITAIVLIMSRMEKSMQSASQPPAKVAIVDLSEELAPELESLCQKHNQSSAKRHIFLQPSAVSKEDLQAYVEKMKRQVRERRLDGCLVIPQDALGGARPQYYMRGDNVADLDAFATVQRLFNDAMIQRRCVRHNLSPELIAAIHQWVSIEQMDVTAGREEKQGNPMKRMMVPVFLILLMFMGMFGVNQQMLTSVIEEKNSRVVEVLLSAVSPFQLMAGKILGLSGCGLTVVAVWGLAAYAGAAYKGIAGMIETGMVGYFLVYFVLGFVLFSSIFAAIGSACNTMREAQNLVLPISLVIVLPMAGWFYFTQHPTGLLATLLSFVPPMTPLLMILRLAVRPDLPLLQVIATVLLLAVSVPLVMWASAKIFRIGILMYGKPPTVRELLRWIRHQ